MCGFQRFVFFKDRRAIVHEELLELRLQVEQAVREAAGMTIKQDPI
jgi:hypothetical protein